MESPRLIGTSFYKTAESTEQLKRSRKPTAVYTAVGPIDSISQRQAPLNKRKSLTMRLIALISAAVFSASNAPAQQPAAVGLSPIPTFASGSTVPNGSPQFVFLGPNIRQVTLSYPAGLASGSLAGARSTLQIERLDQVAQGVTTQVTANSDGT